MNLICLVVDDENSSLDCISRYIEQIPYLDLIKITDDAQVAKQFLESNKIDLLITDINMPHFSGFELYELFNTQCKVIFISGNIDNINEALYKDAIAVLPKPFSLQLFEQAIVKAFKIVSFEKTIEKNRLSTIDIDLLTITQKEVFLLIGQNKTTQQIADLKFTSLKTVENHRQNIRETLKLTGKHSLTLCAVNYVKSLQ